ncbi:MAG TPA: polyprenol phosphomannose-dependent alpha 1,6 mannosyltransferase MptB [Acidimicrobiales bacterium]|nr:polyprenol phosphomannose-dependent alpha 1,6 mannosyltransferase MptB [Acidimicrobiales bacterium]
MSTPMWRAAADTDAPSALRRWWASTAAPTLESVGEPEAARHPVALLARPALLGLVATIAITFGASQDSSVFAFKSPGAWFFGIPSMTTPPGRGLLLSLVASYGGMFLLLRVWLETCSLLSRHPGIAVRAIAVMGSLWVIPLLVAPPLFSKDIYSYAAQGAMVTHGISPYHHGPSALGPGPYLNSVDPLWRNAPAPYGPLWLSLDGIVTSVTAHHVLATVVGLRLLALVGVVLAAASLPTLARGTGRDAATVFALGALNPVVLLHLIAGAHNDALMIGLLMAGLALAKRNRPVLGVIVCTLGAAVKAPAALGVVYIGWHWLGDGTPWRERMRPLVSAGMLAIAVMAVLSAASGLGWGWLGALGTPGVVRSWTDPPTEIGLVVGTITHFLGLGLGVTGAITIMRALGLAVSLGASVALLLASDRIGQLKAIGLSLLLVVVLGPVVQPWYLAWGILVLAPVAFGRWRTALVATTMVGAFIGFPGGTLFLGQLGRSSLWSVALAVAVLVAIPAPPIIARVRQLIAYRRPLVIELD